MSSRVWSLTGVIQWESEVIPLPGYGRYVESAPPLLECREDRVNLSAVLRASRRVPFCVHHEEVLKRVKGMHDALLG
jgi:hypothetical protein